MGDDMARRAEPRRPDFLYAATGAVGAAALIWPLIDPLNPDASVLAVSSIDFDPTGIKEGEEVTIQWRSQPVFVRYRPAAGIAAMQAVPLADLKDPAPDSDRVRAGQEQWLIVFGICTHLGCVPVFNAGMYADGWFCPCHGS